MNEQKQPLPWLGPGVEQEIRAWRGLDWRSHTASQAADLHDDYAVLERYSAITGSYYIASVEVRTNGRWPEPRVNSQGVTAWVLK